ncbi:hypothetical protein PR002_g16531 [Phytophthora rubi]|uniref:Ubiquitin-like domain-containing protein n=1 Tax=Phytophthora rubi TaxID=129364 RepID=A0A6A3KFP1_9STRA|nr:hypothetical protein PR002_g16531 [Phytophthora rubi]
MKLFCAIVGVADSAFPVDIDAGQTVGDLKKAIKVEKMYQFPADELQLFLAKTDDGKWLPDDDDLDKMLQNKVDTSKMKKLRASWKLNKPDLKKTTAPQPWLSAWHPLCHQLQYTVTPNVSNDGLRSMQ